MILKEKLTRLLSGAESSTVMLSGMAVYGENAPFIEVEAASACTVNTNKTYQTIRGFGGTNPMKQDTKHFTYTSDFSQGNFYFLVANSNDGVKKTHWWGYVRWYIMDALPYFFHEGN